MTKIKRIALVGHCGADAMMLRSTVANASPALAIETVNDQRRLTSMLGGDTLLLVNRVLDGAFEAADGVALIEAVCGTQAGVRAMLISNYADAQASAEAAGAMPGFGKNEAYDNKAAAKIRRALEVVE